MNLKITHTTDYVYDAPLHYALQRLRLTPQDGYGQKVLSWQLDLEGANAEVPYEDHMGNITTLISCHGDSHTIRIRVSGEVETIDRTGVVGPHAGFVPLWLYLRQTPLTTPGKGIHKLVKETPPAESLPMLHDLMGRIHKQVIYKIGITTSETTAEEALEHGEGVCQDHSHLFISAARVLGIPARYVSGYMLLEGTAEQAASHAWAEVHIEDLGWVGFDVANNQAPDARYVRIATGLDYSDAAPISGIRLGNAEESLAVSIRIEQ
ncbi:transglutaminase family protein [Kordiimonas pumila]|uniref:Transglutaminase domain-containing protein n=1 Tax=Kordiimonas pumila TaxID=2161677 RepID=A0ABV7D9J3_9PROT|nr:transglutaminase family protein [Kordiimonas pumila]